VHTGASVMESLKNVTGLGAHDQPTTMGGAKVTTTTEVSPTGSTTTRIQDQ
jgi:hypothetical protein